MWASLYVRGVSLCVCCVHIVQPTHIYIYIPDWRSRYKDLIGGLVVRTMGLGFYMYYFVLKTFFFIIFIVLPTHLDRLGNAWEIGGRNAPLTETPQIGGSCTKKKKKMGPPPIVGFLFGGGGFSPHVSQLGFSHT